MSKENSAGLGVNARFGPRTLPEGKAGRYKTEGAIIQVTLNFGGTEINGDDIETPIIPAGFKPLRAIFETEVVAELGGTTPTIEIGTDGSEATNGFSISETQGETVGAYVITSFNGTWATRLAAATTIGVALGGTSPTITNAGKYKVVIEGYLA